MLLAGYMVPHPPIAVPEIGRGEEKKIQATLDSFAEVARDIAGFKPDTIILTSPHHIGTIFTSRRESTPREALRSSGRGR